MGWENVFHCEWNEFGQKILKHYWPNATSYTDITKTDFTIHRGTIDILTGGFPCQPYSLAGKRKGKEDDRHLWPEMLRAVREIQPSWVIGENVFGLVNWSNGLVFDEVQTDLETEGYEIFPYVLPACAVNAPHRRDRIWFVAYGGQTRQKRKIKEVIQGGSKSWVKPSPSNIQPGNFEDVFTNTNNKGLERCKEYRGFREIREIRNKQPPRYIPSNWKEFPNEPPVCGGNDGVPYRVDRVKALGNAIVPQVALQIFKAIEQFEINEAQSKGR